MKTKKILTLVMSLLFTQIFILPTNLFASSNCPDTWNIHITGSVSQLLSTRYISHLYSDTGGIFSRSDFVDRFFKDDSGTLNSQILNLGNNISVSKYFEVSNNQADWYFPNTNGGPVNGSLELFENGKDLNIAIPYFQIDQYFNKGYIRSTFKIETKNCPNNIGYFHSDPEPLQLNEKYLDDKIYSPDEIFKNSNFKDIQKYESDLAGFVSKIDAELKNSGIYSGDYMFRSPDNILLIDGSPPCMTWINQKFVGLKKDCAINIYQVVEQYQNSVYTGSNWYLVSKVSYKYKPLNQISGVKQTRVISCKKGKITKKISGNDPKCPTGYQKIN